MIGRENVIKGLQDAEISLRGFANHFPPLREECHEQADACHDALAMLKEQEKPNGKCVNECECWDSAYERGKQDALKELEEEHRRLLSWLGKFCRHIDNGDAWLTDEENIAFFKEKMKQQFGWDTD